MVELEVISTVKDYIDLQQKGIEALLHFKSFFIPLDVRKAIQYHYFGKPCPKNHMKFYRYCWDKMPHICENCGKHLPSYSAVYISHIKSKGAFIEWVYEPINVNILCGECHNKWEFGTTLQKQDMRIWIPNQEKIDHLREIYNN